MKTAGLILSDGELRRDVLDGIRDVLPITLGVLPFAGVFGALAIERGLSLGELTLASMTIYAGASQYAMLDLMGQGVPPWSIVLAVFAINFRHLLYSASLGRRLAAFSIWQKVIAFFLLVDPLFASAETRAFKQGLRPAYYFSYGTFLYAIWMASNFIGALFGSLIADPAAFGLDFILPLYFTGLVIGFHRRPNFLPVLVISIAASLAVWFTIGSPWHISLGGLAGLLAAALLSKPGEEVGHG
ncbi:MAG: branched-chain amino acid ABC transporter permease [Rhizobiaceae bacterium]|nr:branched-chain amino acid ABC transporter permease [Rhizobiaceae bacterium]